MNYRIRFTNNNARKVQVAVFSNATENLEIAPGKTDDVTRMPEGMSFTFYWRDDGAPCRLCNDSGCNPHEMIMPSADISIVIPDPNGRWPKQTI
ncbi:hypothetical protein UNDYM_5930 (plasmid) [Undibacterium sp. YM2]|uniref:hypothetical protein n=1 Tax=Undibacterium sp. YM2 TaxID=2058625 RepID=UPI001331C5A6|nr:hypothetical protein [Undibacterium sp. YM2]BBB70183.1 hypothetical protein UNDYM_5930 [Undibacterium sp. YM2]